MKNDNSRVIAIILFLTVIVVLCWYFSNIVIYLFFALLFSLAGKPLVELLCKIHIGKFYFPKALAAFIALIVVIGVVAGGIWLIIPFINNEITAIAAIDSEMIIDGYENAMKNIQHFAKEHHICVSTREISQVLANELQTFVFQLDFAHIFGNLINIIAGTFVALFSIFFLTFFSLNDTGIILNTVKKLIPLKLKNNFDNIVADTRKQISRYFAGVFLEMIIIGFFNGIICHILGVPNAVLIGVIAGLLNIIPYIGPLLAVFLNVIICYTSMLPDAAVSAGIGSYLLKIICTFLGAKLLDDFVLQPFIYGKSVQAHPIEIFIVILAAAQLGGIWGMVFAVPVYSLLRIIIKEFFGQYFFNDNSQQSTVNNQQ